MDPLSVLRDFTVRCELDKIVRVNDSFRFGTSYTFPCSIETAYRSKQGPRYTLETLVFFINNHHLKHTEYLPAARSHGLPAVTLPDRKNLLEYLQGIIPTSDSIEFLAPTNPNNNIQPELYRPEDSFTNNNALNNSDNVNVDYMSLIRSVERPLKDRESLLECKNRDFYSVLVQATRREEERSRSDRKDGSGFGSKNDKLGTTNSNVAFEDLGFENSNPKPKMHMKGGAKIGEGVPIILVPSAFQTLITIYNVKEFLEDGVFVATDVKAKQMKGPKPDCITVQKKFSRDRVVTAYEVRDKPSALKADDWDRVVAVFVLGKEWQFKDWPFKDHVEIFNKSKEFLLLQL